MEAAHFQGPGISHGPDLRGRRLEGVLYREERRLSYNES